jgi:Uma2 family endonuclease
MADRADERPKSLIDHITGANMQQTDIMTADELFEMEKDDRRYELIQGRLVCKSPAGFEHSSIGAMVIMHLGVHVVSNQLGRVFDADFGVVFSRDPDTVRVPGVSFIRQERLAGQTDRSRFSEVIPDLAVAVISPSDRLAEITDKALFYIDSGVQLVWVVNPRDHTVTTYSQGDPPRLYTDRDELDGGDVLPDFRLVVGEIFS